MNTQGSVQRVLDRCVPVIAGRPTAEMWCYGWPDALADFAAAGLRICQFDIRGRSWWTGPGRYDFSALDEQIAEFLRMLPEARLIPRVAFGYEGEGWWAAAHPDELAVGHDLAGQPVSFRDAGAPKVECWQSAASDAWTRDTGQALTALVEHCEARYGKHICGYQIGGGITSEWFRWWNFAVGAYEDYGPRARDAFREFLQARYTSDAILQAAWRRTDVTLASADIPAPQRLHTPQLGFLRDPARERDVLDWLEALSEWNAAQLIALCRIAKQACAGRKLVGAFYGYLWPHWNTQNPARSGHLALDRLLESDAIDYISSPYHYDNRCLGGVHHSQTVPQAIERAGKLHVDEVDTATHLTACEQWPFTLQPIPASREEARRLLWRDAAAVLGTAGGAWWMDLRHERWYADAGLQAALRELNALAEQSLAWSGASRAEVALVIDDRSYAYGDLNSNHNQYFTSLPRQFEWSALGFPWDTLLFREVGTARPYQVYVFLNAWYADTATRRAVLARTRCRGVTSIWFYAAGFYDEHGGSPARAGELTGIPVELCDHSAIPEIELAGGGHPLLDEHPDSPRGAVRFGARLSPERQQRLVCNNPRGWDTPIRPVFVPRCPPAIPLGNYVYGGGPGLACVEGDGWRGIYCGAPMLPGWLLRRVAAAAGVHRYTSLGGVIHHRGPLLSVYAPAGGALTVAARAGQVLVPIAPDRRSGRWQPVPAARPAPRWSGEFAPSETRFFLEQT